MAEARAKANAQTAIMHALKRPLARTLALLEPQLGDRASTPNLEPDSVAEFAPQTELDAAGLRRYLDEQVEWTGRTFAEQLRNVGEALRSVYERSANWPGIATRQLHSDLGRFLARLYVNFPAEDAARQSAGGSASGS
jgi:tryptophan 2,3-dioxygenase